jgi:hypothetical protein
MRDPGHDTIVSSIWDDSARRREQTKFEQRYAPFETGSEGRLSKHDPVWQRIRELHAQRFCRAR